MYSIVLFNVDVIGLSKKSLNYLLYLKNCFCVSLPLFGWRALRHMHVKQKSQPPNAQNQWSEKLLG